VFTTARLTAKFHGSRSAPRFTNFAAGSLQSVLRMLVIAGGVYSGAPLILATPVRMTASGGTVQIGE
jgi:hypothetical protein